MSEPEWWEKPAGTAVILTFIVLGSSAVGLVVFVFVTAAIRMMGMQL